MRITPGSTEQRRENDEKFLDALGYLMAYLRVENEMKHEREKEEVLLGEREFSEEDLEYAGIFSQFLESRSSEEEERRDLERSAEIAKEFFEAYAKALEKMGEDIEEELEEHIYTPEEREAVKEVIQSVLHPEETLRTMNELERELKLEPQHVPRPSLADRKDVHPEMRPHIRDAEKAHQEERNRALQDDIALKKTLYALTIALRAGIKMQDAVQNIPALKNNPKLVTVLCDKFSPTAKRVQQMAPAFGNALQQYGEKYVPKLRVEASAKNESGLQSLGLLKTKPTPGNTAKKDPHADFPQKAEDRLASGKQAPTATLKSKG